MNQITEEKAMDLWISGAYTKINGQLAGIKYPFSYLRNDIIVSNGVEYKTRSVINKIISCMIPYSEHKENLGVDSIRYYRGEEISKFPTMSFIRETFTSLTSDKEQGISFKGDSGCLFCVNIDDDVYCIETGIEKELLIEPNCYWKFRKFENGMYFVDILSFTEGVPFYNDLF